MFKQFLNMFHSSLRRNAPGMAGSIAAGAGTVPSRSQLVPAGSGTTVNHPPPAKAAARTCGTSAQACLRESNIWEGYRR